MKQLTKSSFPTNNAVSLDVHNGFVTAGFGPNFGSQQVALKDPDGVITVLDLPANMLGGGSDRLSLRSAVMVRVNEKLLVYAATNRGLCVYDIDAEKEKWSIEFKDQNLEWMVPDWKHAGVYAKIWGSDDVWYFDGQKVSIKADPRGMAKLVSGPNGTLYNLCDTEISFFDGDRWSALNFPDDEDPIDMLLDEYGQLWVCTPKKVYVREGGEFQVKLVYDPDDVSDIKMFTVDGLEQKVYVMTDDLALDTHDLASGDTPKRDWFRQGTNCLITDSDNILWIGTTAGAFVPNGSKITKFQKFWAVVDKDNLPYPDGMEGNVCAVQTQDDRNPMSEAGIVGVASFDGNFANVAFTHTKAGDPFTYVTILSAGKPYAYFLNGDHDLPHALETVNAVWVNPEEPKLPDDVEDGNPRFFRVRLLSKAKGFRIAKERAIMNNPEKVNIEMEIVEFPEKDGAEISAETAENIRGLILKTMNVDLASMDNLQELQCTSKIGRHLSSTKTILDTGVVYELWMAMTDAPTDDWSVLDVPNIDSVFARKVDPDTLLADVRKIANSAQTKTLTGARDSVINAATSAKLAELIGFKSQQPPAPEEQSETVAAETDEEAAPPEESGQVAEAEAEPADEPTTMGEVGPDSIVLAALEENKADMITEYLTVCLEDLPSSVASDLAKQMVDAEKRNPSLLPAELFQKAFGMANHAKSQIPDDVLQMLPPFLRKQIESGNVEVVDSGTISIAMPDFGSLGMLTGGDVPEGILRAMKRIASLKGSRSGLISSGSLGGLSDFLGEFIAQTGECNCPECRELRGEL